MGHVSRHPSTMHEDVISPECLMSWMAENELDEACAAEAIGISRQMLRDFLSGLKPIPNAIWLACLGWQIVGSPSAES